MAKVLTIVSANELVVGTRGLNGGYALAKPPTEISIYEIISLFGKAGSSDDFCPMGPGWCEVKEKCPLHETLSKLRQKAVTDLKKISLDVFEESHLE